MFWKKKTESSQSMPPLCEDCKWFRLYPSSPGLSKCASPRIEGNALVARNAVDDLKYCTNARGFEHHCGHRGRYFEARPNPQPDQEAPPYLSVLQNIDCSLLRIAKKLEQPANPKTKRAR